MAREPSAHYKAIAAEVEMFRKRENSNMKRIKALEDELTIIKDMLKDLSISAPGKALKPAAPEKPGKDDYARLNEVVTKMRPELVSLWDIYLDLGFGSYKTILAAAGNAGITEEITDEVNGYSLTGKFADKVALMDLLRDMVCGSNVKLEYAEDGTLKDSCLISKMAASKSAVVGSFRVPTNIPIRWTFRLAEKEALRECKRLNSYSTFIEMYASTYGRALGMDEDECKTLIDLLIRDGKIIRDGNTIKAAS